jgi:hypothetical protein
LIGGITEETLPEAAARPQFTSSWQASRIRKHMMKNTLLLLTILTAINSVVNAQGLCRNYLAEQYSGGAGFYVDVENQVQPGDSVCRLQNIRLIVGSGDGSAFNYASGSGLLQFDHEYVATGMVGLGNLELRLNGSVVSNVAGGFVPYAGAFDGNMIPGWASSPAEYVIVVEDVQLKSSGGKHLDLSFAKEASRVYPLFGFDPAGPRRAVWNMPEGDSLTVTVKFRVIHAPEVAPYAPYFNRYGQSVQAEWPGKITNDEQLVQAAATEQKKLKAWGAPTQFDKYGGLINHSWQAAATGFYRVEQKNGYWWLISPLGNPCFYKAFTTAPGGTWDRTPVTGRENLFQDLPPQTGDDAVVWTQGAWGGDSNVDYLIFQAANLIRKYGGSDWQSALLNITEQRVKSWGFSGLGKFSDFVGMPVIGGLGRGSAPNAPGISHPDVFDPAIQGQMLSDLTSEIGSEVNDATIVGWSVGNEDSELVATWEISDVFSQEDANVPLKQALVNCALRKVYAGNLQALAAAWSIQATTIQDVYASTSAVVPAGDQEVLRQYFEDRYDNFLYTTIKKIDPNHLYLGNWYLVGGYATDADWQVISRNVDVIGYDRYNYGVTDAHFASLLQTAGKPALLGEFSFPPTYRMQRGFGAFGTYTDSDASAGDLYAQVLDEAAGNPYIIGTDWFQYRDEAISGRGPGSGPGLVYGEHYAFGLIDMADNPKWDMIERIRTANLSVAAKRLANTLK